MNRVRLIDISNTGNDSSQICLGFAADTSEKSRQLVYLIRFSEEKNRIQKLLMSKG